MIDCTRYFSTGPVAVREKGGLIGLGYTKPGRAESPAIGSGRPGRLDPDEIRRLIATGCSANETARILGAHRSTISYWIKKLEIQAPKDGWSTMRKAREYGT